MLVDVRNIIGVARLQEKSYSNELDAKFAELEGAFDEDTQATLTALTNALNEVITNYSPLALLITTLVVSCAIPVSASGFVSFTTSIPSN